MWRRWTASLKTSRSPTAVLRLARRHYRICALSEDSRSCSRRRTPSHSRRSHSRRQDPFMNKAQAHDLAAQRRLAFSRRHFLRGLGACVALPMFESLRPLSVLAATEARPGTTETGAPLRTAFMCFPNGAIPGAWWPSGADKDFEFSRTLKPLEPLREHLQVLGRARSEAGQRRARTARRPRAGQWRVPDGCPAEEERDRRARGRFNRSGDRPGRSDI